MEDFICTKDIQEVIAAKGLSHEMRDGLMVFNKSMVAESKAAAVYEPDECEMPDPDDAEEAAEEVAELPDPPSYFPSQEDLDIINTLTYGDWKFKGDGDVYSFRFASATTAEDSDNQFIDPQGLDDLEPMSYGSSGVTDHIWSAKEIIGTFYKSERIGNHLIEHIYVPATKRDVVQNFLQGLWRRLSISFGAKASDHICTICERSIYDDRCAHVPGVIYNGVKCLDHIKRVTKKFETSVVLQGKNPEAMVAGQKGENNPPDTITLDEVTIEDNSPMPDEPKPAEQAAPEAAPATTPEVQEPAAAEVTSGKGIDADALANTVIEAVKAQLGEQKPVVIEGLDEIKTAQKAFVESLTSVTESLKGMAAHNETLKSELAALKTELASVKGLVEVASSQFSVESMKALMTPEPEEEVPSNWLARLHMGLDNGGSQ